MALIQIDDKLASAVQLAVFQATGITASGTSDLLETDLAELSGAIADRYPTPANAVDLFTSARVLYRAIGLDPTKTRPSSESLIRRVIKGTGLYRINRVVDSCNLCSMDFALPVGLYDTATVGWPATLRLGEEGEGYGGLGKAHVNVTGRMTLADSEGPFGNPSSDSFRTRIREDTTACTFVIYGPSNYDKSRLEKQLQLAGERMVRYAGGEVIFSALI
jgi:DNA/RNA-binding domain of Phe-tRNA-synthetase-like protein